jgi:hypothetical protein
VKKTLLVAALLFGVATLYVGYSIVASVPRTLEAGLKSIAEGNGVTNAFRKFDFLCFSESSAAGRLDSYHAAKRAGIDLTASLDPKSREKCGLDGSCCSWNLPSDSAGVIGLIRGSEIECVPIKRFVYVLDGEQEACIPTTALKVTRETFTSKTVFPGRPWIAMPGQQYYKIGRR